MLTSELTWFLGGQVFPLSFWSVLESGSDPLENRHSRPELAKQLGPKPCHHAFLPWPVGCWKVENEGQPFFGIRPLAITHS